MGFLKWIAFILGFALGLATAAAAGTVFLTYLFTGKFPSIKSAGEERPEVVLMTPDEVVAFVREQVLKEDAGAPVAEVAGGETDAEA